MCAGELFRIDAAAELRALAEDRLQGAWEVPAELVRFALARGATSVDLKLSRRSLRLVAPGAVVTRADLAALASALAVASGDDTRHRALVTLEERAADALLFVAALRGAAAVLRCAEPGSTLELALPRGAVAEDGDGAAPGLEIRVQRPRYDRERALEWLHEACRHSPVEVVVNGRQIWRGFVDGLFKMRVGTPLPAQLAISSRGDSPRLHLLCHGVVAARAAVPGFPAFHAAVEMSGAVAHGASAAMLRDAVQPHLRQLIDAAVELMIRCVPRLPTLPEETQRRLLHLLLEAAARDLRRQEISELPLVTAINGAAQQQWLRLAEMAEGARRGDGWVQVLGPADEPRDFALGAAATPVLGAADRSLVQRITGVRFCAPPALDAPARRLRPWRARWRDFCRDLAGRLRADGWSAAAARQLTQPEEYFLDRVAECGARVHDGRTLSWQLCEGRRRPRIDASGTLRLGRRNPQVVLAVDALQRDPDALFPGLLALALPRQVDLGELREAWRHKLSEDATGR